MARSLAPVHPGEVLAEEFLAPMGLTQYRLAKDTSVPARRINEIVKGLRAISADTALRLARYFGTSDLFWLNLQARYDLEIEKDRLGRRLNAEVRAFQPAPQRTASAESSQRRASQKVVRSAMVRKAK
jgi:addiction module HigA family antidote